MNRVDDEVKKRPETIRIRKISVISSKLSKANASIITGNMKSSSMGLISINSGCLTSRNEKSSKINDAIRVNPNELQRFGQFEDDSVLTTLNQLFSINKKTSFSKLPAIERKKSCRLILTERKYDAKFIKRQGKIK